MKIALVHDHLAQDGGAENVLRAFCEIWPDAPVYVVVHDPKHAHPYFLKKDIRTSFIQRLPLGVKKYQWYFPLMPTAVESYDLSEFDVVLSTTSSFAKGVITRPETVHISYCHTPTRFLWSDTHSYVTDMSGNRFVKNILQLLLTRIRMWDRLASDRVDYFITNSNAVEKRLRKYYKRDSVVIYPPVDVADFTPVSKEEVGDYYLAGGRLVPYKRFDLIVEACMKTGKKLKIFGSGPALADLKRQAGNNANIEFLGRVPDAERKALFEHCLAFINPQEEDFGITMIEALAAGRPVIGLNKAGAKEIVVPGVHGELMAHQSWEDLANLLIDFDPMRYDPAVIRERALTFSLERFTNEIESFVTESYNAFQKTT